MSVKTTTFGGVTLTQSDAEKFVNQVKFGRPTKVAAERGRKLVSEFQDRGFVEISLK